MTLQLGALRPVIVSIKPVTYEIAKHLNTILAFLVGNSPYHTQYTHTYKSYCHTHSTCPFPEYSSPFVERAAHSTAPFSSSPHKSQPSLPPPLDNFPTKPIATRCPKRKSRAVKSDNLTNNTAIPSLPLPISEKVSLSFFQDKARAQCANSCLCM